MSMHECRNCGSSKIIKGVKIQDQGQHSNGKLSTAVATKPDALIFKGWVLTPILADVCGDCGELRLYVTEPQKMYEASQAASRAE